MPAVNDICLSLILIGLYLCGIIGVFTALRSKGTSIATSIAVSVPITQAIFSVIFQARFLSESALVGIIASLGFVFWSARSIRQEHALISRDRARIWRFCRSWPLVTIPFGICLLYSAFQVLLLPYTNIDGATYHLPRVWLFIQENTLQLEEFTRYHEVIFPVGSDILFYPFLALKTTAGISIFCLTSYLAIGAGVYRIARFWACTRSAALCALIMLSLNVIVLQSVSIKNDIIMASAAIAAFAITLELTPKSSYRQLLLLLSLCIFGASIKTTFPAFSIGLLGLTIWKLKLWQVVTIRRLLTEARADIKLTLLLAIPLIIASQAWLFAWNATHYDSWSGPESFTQRHKQHDGFKGLAANSTRYAFHTLEIGFVTDSIVSPAFGLPSLSATLNQVYANHFEPYFKEAGSERGAFEHVTLTHEDYSWFGIFGAAILFICTPLAILRQPKCIPYLLPAFIYYLLISGCVSWMIWNGRFMTTFFIALTPALAIALHIFSHKSFHKLLAALALCSLVTVKVIDFNRPILAIGKMVSREIEITPSSIFHYSFSEGQNIWTKVINGNRFNPGNPNELLAQIPPGANVALIGFGHLGHFNFYTARPDIRWRPLNGNRHYGEIDTTAALGEFIQSDINYCVVIGPMPEGIPYGLALHCDDNYGHLITKRPETDEL